MLFFLNLDGTVTRSDTDHVYQGQNKVANVELFTLISPAQSAIQVAFTLPNGLTTTYAPMSYVGAYSVDESNQKQVHRWKLAVPYNVTEVEGQVGVSFNVLLNDGTSGQTQETINQTTYTSSFTVEYSALPIPPTTATESELEQILTLLNLYYTQNASLAAKQPFVVGTVNTNTLGANQQASVAVEQSAAADSNGNYPTNFDFGIPQGTTFTPSVDDNGNISWSNDGGKANPVTKNIKGIQGNTGATPDIEMQATVDANVGTPSVAVEKSGTAENPKFTLAFSNIKGAQGEQGVGVKSITSGTPTVVNDKTNTPITITLTDNTTVDLVVSAENGKDGTSTTVDIVQATGQSTTAVMSQKAVTDELNKKANSADLATVATSGNYNDLLNKPTIPTDYVPNTRKVNNKALSSDITLGASDVGALPTAGGTVTGNLTVGGNLTINGTTTTVDSTTLQVKDKLIEVAHGNTTTLTTPAGLVAPKYDGTNSGALVFNGDGIASVGDVVLDASGNIDVAQSNLQPLATRTGLVNDNLVKYDGTNQTLIDTGKKISDLATAAQVNAKYTKPSNGIPKSDLASSVQTSLGKADTALQEAPVTSVNGRLGSITLDAEDVGALPNTTTYVSSINGQTGGLTLIAQDVGALSDNYEPKAELVTIALTDWVADSTIAPFAYKAAKTLTTYNMGGYDAVSMGYARNADLLVGATAGIAIGEVPITLGGGKNITFYAVQKPTAQLQVVVYIELALVYGID